MRKTWGAEHNLPGEGAGEKGRDMPTTLLTDDIPQNHGQPFEDAPETDIGPGEGSTLVVNGSRRYGLLRAAPLLAGARAESLGATVDGRGIGHHEVDRFRGAAAGLATADGLALWAVTVRPAGDVRAIFREWCRRAGQAAGRLGCPRWYIVTAWSVSPALHVHGIVGWPRGEGARLRAVCGAACFERAALEAGCCIKVSPITDLDGWCSYALKEMTTQAHYSRGGSRQSGSHKMEAAGDRVRLSPDLREDAIAGAWVRDWRRTNATAKPVPVRPKRRPAIPKPARRPVVDLVPGARQLDLFGDPAPTRLRDYAGGVMPRSVAHEVEWRRKRLGLSHAAIGQRVGLSRGQYGNAVARGVFGLSHAAAARLRDFLLTAA